MQGKLELVTGIPVQNQSISVLSSEDATDPLVVLSDDTRQLGFYGVRDWQVLKVSLRTLFGNLFPNVSLAGRRFESCNIVYWAAHGHISS